jgi:hypothetical protein
MLKGYTPIGGIGEYEFQEVSETRVEPLKTR